MAELTQAAQDVLAERRRQIEIEGWTSYHDDDHDLEELANAAACYAMKPSARRVMVSSYSNDTIFDRVWPFYKEWWKPKDRRRDLVKAGALILAEIERLDRLKVPHA